MHRSVSIAALLILSLAGSAFAQNPSINKLRLTVTAVKERVAKEKSESTSEEQVSEKWVYAVRVKNTSFSDLENLKLEYRAFMKDDFHGAKSTKLQREAGSLTIEKLAKHGEYPFTTEPFVVEKSELKGGWRYADGAKPKVKDSLYGIWIRIYQKEELVYELLIPSTLKSEKW